MNNMSGSLSMLPGRGQWPYPPQSGSLQALQSAQLATLSAVPHAHISQDSCSSPFQQPLARPETSLPKGSLGTFWADSWGPPQICWIRTFFGWCLEKARPQTLWILLFPSDFDGSWSLKTMVMENCFWVRYSSQVLPNMVCMHSMESEPIFCWGEVEMGSIGS